MKYYVEWKIIGKEEHRTKGSMLKEDAKLIEAMLWSYVSVEWVKIKLENNAFR